MSETYDAIRDFLDIVAKDKTLAIDYESFYPDTFSAKVYSREFGSHYWHNPHGPAVIHHNFNDDTLYIEYFINGLPSRLHGPACVGFSPFIGSSYIYEWRYVGKLVPLSVVKDFANQVGFNFLEIDTESHNDPRFIEFEKLMGEYVGLVGKN